MEQLSLLKAFAALLFVLSLIGGCAYIFKRWGIGGLVKPTSPKDKRLKVVEILPIDNQRRLMLIRRDDVEHLLLLGPHGDVVVEEIEKPSSAKTKKKD
jgi:flagellar protein FliO/FliZ